VVKALDEARGFVTVDDLRSEGLHVWFWEANPSGMFAPFNPTLSC
jgi:hypothetical protein